MNRFTTHRGHFSIAFALVLGLMGSPIAAQTPATVEFTAFPTYSSVNAAFPVDPIVTVKDAGGAILTSYVGPVSITLKGGTTGAVLGGTTTVSAEAGVATFPGLSISKTGFGYKLTATAGSATVDSSALNVALAAYPGRKLTSPTASAESVVYVGDSAGWLHAVNTATGASVFDVDITVGDVVAPANAGRQALGRLTRWDLSGTQRIFCVTSDNYLMVFDLDGTPVWTAHLEGGGTEVNASAMCLNDAVYVATADGTMTTVTKLSAAGSVIAHQHFPGVSTSSVSVFGDSVFLSTPEASFRLAASDLTARNVFAAATAPPFVSNNAGSPVAIFVTTDGRVLARSAVTGAAIDTFGCNGSASLNVNLYSSSASFLSALGSSTYYTEDFAGLEESPVSPWTSSLTNGYQFTADSGGGLKRIGAYSLSANAAGSSITISFPSGVRAVGGKFTLTDAAGASMTVSNGITVRYEPSGATSRFSSGTDSYRGLITDSDITSMTISTSSSLYYVVVDDVTVSEQAAPALVFASAPFVRGGIVLIGGMDNKVYEVNIATGKGAGLAGTMIKYSAPATGSITAGVGIHPAGLGSVVFGSTNGTYYDSSFSPGGSTDAKVIGSPIRTAPAYDPGTNTISIAADDGLLYQIPKISSDIKKNQ